MNAVDFICLTLFFISQLLQGLENVEIVGKDEKKSHFPIRVGHAHILKSISETEFNSKI